MPQADANVQYTLQSNTGEIILVSSDCPPPCTRRWPVRGSRPVPGQEEHTLGMQFFGEETLTYEVDRRAEDGSLLEHVKICAFRNTGSPDDYFEPLRVFMT